MSLPVCKFYNLNQTCRFGKYCQYSHSSQRPPPDIVTVPQSSQDEKSVVEEHQSAALSVNKNLISFDSKPKDEKESTVSKGFSSSTENFSCASSHAEDSAVRKNLEPQRNPNICRHFARSGHCYYGKNCHFVHSIYDSTPEGNRPGFRKGTKPSNASVSSTRSRHRDQIPPRFTRAKEQQAQSSTAEADTPNDLSNVSDALNVKEDSLGKGPPTLESEANKEKPHSQDTERKVCPFFKARRCNRGRNCKFLHPVRGEDGENQSGRMVNERKDALPLEQRPDSSSGGKPTPEAMRVSKPVGIAGKQVFTLKELEEFGQSKVKEGEINAIKRRFPKDKITVIDDEKQDKFSVRIIFIPSDPDWPFDVKTFELVLTLPSKYPEDTMSVKLPTDQNMPETVRRYVEITINEWLQERAGKMKDKGRAELVFRPFLRWLDRSLEDITTEALKQLKRELVAKAAGLEFLSPSQLQEKLRAEGSDSGEDTGSAEESGDDDSSSGEENYNEDSDNDDDEEEQPSMGLSLDPEKKGTQVELRHLQLRENASALLLDRLKLVLQCGRCKTHADLTLPQNRVMSMSCIKCNQNQFAHYRASLAHQFSSVVGYLDLDGCLAFDLVLQDCRAVVTCLGCSKLTRMDGLVAGQMTDGWCQACHARFKVATEAVKFTQLAPSGIDNTAHHQKVDVSKPRKPPKDPAIREGYPLPEFGTCKHYKHSYRWLRFPCCGKAYPCDVCHDKKEDHEFVFATRMICGHCCKEQNFAGSSPCKSCSQHLTKIRSAHWEGGKGCRDKISMSKNDSQKYRNQNKTKSKTNKKQVESGGKKNTKLRRV